MSSPPLFNPSGPTFDSYHHFRKRFEDQKIVYMDWCLEEAERNVNPSYTSRELTTKSKEIADKAFKEFETVILANSEPMKEKVESSLYINGVKTLFSRKLRDEIEELLSGKMKLWHETPLDYSRTSSSEGLSDEWNKSSRSFYSF